MKHLLGYLLAALIGAAGATGVMFAAGAGAADDHAVTASPTVSASPTKPAAFTVSGTFTVEAATAAMTSADGGGCWTDDGYDDIDSGTQVVVRDRHGTTMAIGELGAAERDGSNCAFSFVVSEVPAGKGIYRIEVSHRGELEYTEEQIRTHLELELG
ncbi:hypothetical protein [Flindersiella endophytica]